MAIKNSAPVTMEDKPVLPPSATPAEDSTKVVTVEVPHTAPQVVATASASMALSILGTLPSFVRRSPLAQAPYNVPSVSNISTRQKASAVVMIRTTNSVEVCSARYAEKSKPSVNTLPNA